MVTNQGNIGLMLANNESPCTVSQFRQPRAAGFFRHRTCHRLTTSPMLAVCYGYGDPRRQLAGSPGYQFAANTPPIILGERPQVERARHLSARDTGHGQRRP